MLLRFFATAQNDIFQNGRFWTDAYILDLGADFRENTRGYEGGSTDIRADSGFSKTFEARPSILECRDNYRL